MDICQVSPTDGSCINWNTSEWQPGKFSTVNLQSLWKNNHPDWTLWAGYTYNVQVGIAQHPCNAGVFQFLSFRVVSSGCREGLPDENSITLYPNPASNDLRIEGLEKVEGEIQYAIFDAAGKLMKQDYLLTPTYPVDLQGLNNGLYVIQLITNQERIAKKFTVVK